MLPQNFVNLDEPTDQSVYISQEFLHFMKFQYLLTKRKKDKFLRKKKKKKKKKKKIAAFLSLALLF